MLQERNFLIHDPDHDAIYSKRQEALREMERERDRKGNFVPTKGKTWQELTEWARMHYGEVWYKHRMAVDQDQREVEEALDPCRKYQMRSKQSKRFKILREIQTQTDEDLLAMGKTWPQIMAWPIEASDVMPSVETTAMFVSSPCGSSEHSAHSGISTYPPTPTDYRHKAMDGPQGPEYERDGNWHFLEWWAVCRRFSQCRYEESRVNKAYALRSRREDEECAQRNEEEWAAINDLKRKDYMRYERLKEELIQRREDHDFRQKGGTQEQIDAMHKKKAAEEERRKQEMQIFLRKHNVREGPLFGFAPGEEARSKWALPAKHTETGSDSEKISMKIRNGRVTKPTARTQNTRRGRNQSLRSPRIASDVPTRRRAPARSKPVPEPQASPRRSRRLAKQPPEFGQLLGRGETPAPIRTVKQRSNAHKSSGSKQTPMSGAKPTGVSKLGQAKKSRARGSRKR